MPTVGWSGVHRAVVWEFNEQSLWGKLMFAFDERGHDAVDAISAALIVKQSSIAREIRLHSEMRDRITKSIDFHSTSVYGGVGSTWPYPGQLIEVHLNSDRNLVAVFYQGTEG